MPVVNAPCEVRVAPRVSLGSLYHVHMMDPPTKYNAFPFSSRTPVADDALSQTMRLDRYWSLYVGKNSPAVPFAAIWIN